MTRSALLLALTALVAMGACRTYENYSPLLNQDGLIPADKYAKYGSDQAAAMAIARAYGDWYAGGTREAYALQSDGALAYARSLPQVATVVADAPGYRLTVTFKSGWRTAIVPIGKQ